MRDIILFTERQIVKDECFDVMKREIKNIKENGDGLMIDGKNRLYLNFSSERINDPKDDASEDFQKHVPIDNAHLTFMETYRSIDAKRVITVIAGIYGNVFVYIDDTDWYGSAKNFTETKFDF